MSDREPAPEAATLCELDRLNGYSVIASAPYPVEEGNINSRVVILDRLEQPQRYVCAVHCYGAEEWLWGKYFSSIERAMKAFTDRIARKYPEPVGGQTHDEEENAS